jgi:hypothetical protein
MTVLRRSGVEEKRSVNRSLRNTIEKLKKRRLGVSSTLTQRERLSRQDFIQYRAVEVVQTKQRKVQEE